MMKNEELDELVKKLQEFLMVYDLRQNDSYAIDKAIEIIDKVYFNQTKAVSR